MNICIFTELICRQLSQTSAQSIQLFKKRYIGCIANRVLHKVSRVWQFGKTMHLYMQATTMLSHQKGVLV